MMRKVICSTLAVLSAYSLLPGRLSHAETKGIYLEARTCQVYTGPCFANGEVGLAGKDAVLSWNIERGFGGASDLSGLNVVAVVRNRDTLGFGGMRDAQGLRAMVLVDARANAAQRAALTDFAAEHGGFDRTAVEKVVSVPIEMSLDTATLAGRLKAGKLVKLKTRKARPTDCICSNEAAYYPPLAQVTNFAPGVTTEGRVVARKLGTSWSIPHTRTAYMATFDY